MYSSIKSINGNASTPKRRRLGTGRISRRNLNIFEKENKFTSPLRSSSPLNRLDDPPLPCNQIEYLSESGNNSSVASDIPCSPGILDNSIMRNIDNWESLVVSKHLNNSQVSSTMCKEFNEIEDISENISKHNITKEVSTSMCKEFNEIEDISENISKHNITKEVSTSMCKEFNEIEDISENISKHNITKEVSTSMCKEFNEIEDISENISKHDITKEVSTSMCKELNEIADVSENISKHNITKEVSTSMCKEFNEIADISENISKHNVSKEVSTSICKELDEIEDISDDMFYSKLEMESSQNNLLTSRYKKRFCKSVEESFDAINQSIRQDELNRIDNSVLFETKDSFLLDIKESSIVEDKERNKNNLTMPVIDKERNNSFYGLPIVTKSLFKSYRNIEKFYDWQEECLNLPAIKERRNLIYALPTSGGKTLVAEVLMLREVLNRKKNALFVLPFVAIVQEKIWSLSPFAIKLDFLVEEYAAGKGLIPPKKRRKKNSIYIATIEKGLALIRSLIEMNRLDEIGLIVVDELHLIGEAGRGGTLEMLLSTVLFAKKGIQIVGMSATIGNLPVIAKFLHADVFERDFRPVELEEYVKLGDVLHKIQWREGGMELVPGRQLAFDYSSAATTLDPDWLGGLVSEVVPSGSCLVFCPTKRNCENVAVLLCKLQRREMTYHRQHERAALSAALRAEGAGPTLCHGVRAGVAFHHAGLSSDERVLLEHAFRSGVISVLCCTSTLAAGVNLPARRVIVRAPRVGRQGLSLGAYRQMVGRAGRAGVCDTGESIIISSALEWPQLRATLQGGLPPARSVLSPPALLLSGVALQLCSARHELTELLRGTLLATELHCDSDSERARQKVSELCDASIESLVQSDALQLQTTDSTDGVTSELRSDSVLVVSKVGRAAIKGCMELSVAKQLLQDLEVASRSLVLMGSLHLLYLVSPHDCAAVRPDYRHYYSLYCNLDEEGVQTAKILGITEMNAIRMMTGKPITNVPESVLCRFYLALMLHDLWKQVPFREVADRYNVPRGTVQSVMSSSAAFASCAQKVCEELEPLWMFRALFAELATRLVHCAAPELHQLMTLPNVKKARAIQLMRAGYKRLEDVAKASEDRLVAEVAHMSRSAATHLISAARMMLIEKVENLRAEAEDVMETLNV